MNATEQRRHPRAPVGRLVHYQVQGQALTGTVQELSEGGARLETLLPLPEGERVKLELPLSRWAGSPDGCQLEGVVVRSHGCRAVLTFPRPLPRHSLLLRDFVWRSKLLPRLS